MSLAIIYSRASQGIGAPLVEVEVDCGKGMAGMHIVGLPETAVRESRDRVRSAIINSGFEFPSKRITVNLAPADLPKEGGRFDLPIALGILAASQQIPKNRLAEHEFVGELALTGELRGLPGVLPLVLAASDAKRHLIVPIQNQEEAGLAKKTTVFSAHHLLDVCAYLQGVKQLNACIQKIEQVPLLAELDLADVRGQEHAKRALEIAAAGRHSLLYIGPPGTGKTMLASRLTSLLPALQEEQALEAAAIASISSIGFDPKQWSHIPYRSPHHTSSSVALVGGGRPPKPGEISLAHHGVLFLDELPEFSRHVLECLREPLESGQITISRAAYQMSFPAHFQFIAAMNPCPCGYAGSQEMLCRCKEEQVQRYLAKLSGPLLDRLDMHVEVGHVPQEAILATTQTTAETSDIVRKRVLAARERQYARQKRCNAMLSAKQLESVAQITDAAQSILAESMRKFRFSARVYHRIVKLARTIADLSDSPAVHEWHVSEAMGYRVLDRRKLLADRV